MLHRHEWQLCPVHADRRSNAGSAFCSANYVLQPNNNFSYVESHSASGYDIIVSGAWTSDQSRCGTETAWSFDALLSSCLDGCSTDFFYVDENGSETTSYGGGYGLKPPGSRGCLLLELHASSTSKRGDSFFDSRIWLAHRSNLNLMALRQEPTVSSLWPIAPDHDMRSHLFNQSYLAFLVNGSATLVMVC